MRLWAGVLALLAICVGQASLAEGFRSAAPPLKAVSRTDSYLATAPALSASSSARNYVATAPALRAAASSTSYRVQAPLLRATSHGTGFLAKAPALRAIQKTNDFRVAAPVLRASVRTTSYLAVAPALRAGTQADKYRANAPTLRVVVGTGRYSAASPTLAAHALPEQVQTDPVSIVQDRPSDLLCPNLLQCFAGDQIRTVENDMASLGYTPENHANFCADIAQSLGQCSAIAPHAKSGTTEAEIPLNAATQDFHLFRCIPLEVYAIDLQRRTDAGEDTDAEELRLVALVSEASNHMFTGRADLWCDQITAGLP